MNTRAEWKQYDSFAPSRLRLSRVLYACRVEYGVRPCGAGRRVALSAAQEAAHALRTSARRAAVLPPKTKKNTIDFEVMRALAVYEPMGLGAPREPNASERRRGGRVRHDGGIRGRDLREDRARGGRRRAEYRGARRGRRRARVRPAAIVLRPGRFRIDVDLERGLPRRPNRRRDAGHVLRVLFRGDVEPPLQHFEEACLQGVEFFRPHTPDLRIEAVRVEAIIEVLGREEYGRQDQPVYVGFVHREALVQLHEPIHVDQRQHKAFRGAPEVRGEA